MPTGPIQQIRRALSNGREGFHEMVGRPITPQALDPFCPFSYSRLLTEIQQMHEYEKSNHLPNAKVRCLTCSSALHAEF